LACSKDAIGKFFAYKLSKAVVVDLGREGVAISPMPSVMFAFSHVGTVGMNLVGLVTSQTLLTKFIRDVARNWVIAHQDHA